VNLTEHGIERVAVVGAGMMGAQIASLIAAHGYQVALTDAITGALPKAERRSVEETLPIVSWTSCPADSRLERNEVVYHVVFLVTRKADMSQEDFVDYWINKHTQLTAQLPGLRAYRCFPMIGQMDGPKPPFHAIAYIAFDDEESCKAALESEEFRTAVADGPNFQSADETYGFFAREYVIV